MKNFFKNQRGFSLMELLIVMSIIGVISVIAIPKFTGTITVANTTKIQADLRTLNSSIALYYAQKGKYPQNIKTDLANYIVDVSNLKPPTGSFYLKDQNGAEIEITDTEYTLASDKTQALFQGHGISEIGHK